MDKILVDLQCLYEYCRMFGMGGDFEFEHLFAKLRSDIVLKGKDFDRLCEMFSDPEVLMKFTNREIEE